MQAGFSLPELTAGSLWARAMYMPVALCFMRGSQKYEALSRLSFSFMKPGSGSASFHETLYELTLVFISCASSKALVMHGTRLAPTDMMGISLAL